MKYVEEEKKNCMPVQIRKRMPIQMPHVELDELKEGRKQFSEDEWLDVMMRSIGRPAYGKTVWRYGCPVLDKERQ